MISLDVNGKRHDLDVSGDMPLLWVLRDNLGLTGTKFGCGLGQCGACTVHVDGVATRSCITTVAAVGGQEGDDHRGIRRPTRATRCRRPGSPSRCRSAATASRARS